jgi:hypothetical protein
METFRRPSKATHVTEAWVSDDLAMTMLEINRDLRTRYETRIRRSHVNRQEPDGSLFEIPAGYKINPPSEENPPSKANSKPNAKSKLNPLDVRFPLIGTYLRRL